MKALERSATWPFLFQCLLSYKLYLLFMGVNTPSGIFLFFLTALLCIAVQCSAFECSTVQYSAMQFISVQCSAVQCSAVQCIMSVQFSAVQCSAPHHCTVQVLCRQTAALSNQVTEAGKTWPLHSAVLEESGKSASELI